MRKLQYTVLGLMIFAAGYFSHLVIPIKKSAHIPEEIERKIDQDTLEMIARGIPARMTYDTGDRCFYIRMDIGLGGAVSYVMYYSPLTGQKLPTSEK